ncbi:hypothetical protein QYM36_008320 [Artemia franciscana]|uniref:Uncharacterized protein n=1 Tax=Artemia franciscana TaxID=6661 RepID=A0AA88IPQ5_ARTSF|nr:hypothetical protein QYM36_008320 [Artemia franciscana]
MERRTDATGDILERPTNTHPLTLILSTQTSKVTCRQNRHLHHHQPPGWEHRIAHLQAQFHAQCHLCLQLHLQRDLPLRQMIPEPQCLLCNPQSDPTYQLEPDLTYHVFWQKCQATKEV